MEDNYINGAMDPLGTEVAELETLKLQWRNLSQRIERLENKMLSNDSRKVIDGKISSARELLLKKYKRFFILGICMAIVTPVMFMSMLTEFGIDETNKLIISGLFWLYFLTAALMDAYLMRKTKEIEPAEWPVSKVRAEAIRLKKFHHKCMAILIPFAIITIGYFVYNLASDVYILIGIAVGATIGLAVGLKQYFEMMAAYKSMIEED